MTTDKKSKAEQRTPEARPAPNPSCGWCRGNPIGDCAICQARPSTQETYADELPEAVVKGTRFAKSSGRKLGKGSTDPVLCDACGRDLATEVGSRTDKASSDDYRPMQAALAERRDVVAWLLMRREPPDINRHAASLAEGIDRGEHLGAGYQIKTTPNKLPTPGHTCNAHDGESYDLRCARCVSLRIATEGPLLEVGSRPAKAVCAEQGAAEERQRIVTWLRTSPVVADSVIGDIADDIERGIHLSTWAGEAPKGAGGGPGRPDEKRDPGLQLSPAPSAQTQSSTAEPVQRRYPTTPQDPKAMLDALTEINQLSYFTRGNLSVAALERRLKEVYEASHHAIAVPADYEPHRPETVVALRDALPEEIDVEGIVDSKGVRFIGKAKRQPDGTWQCLADVGGALCRVEVTVTTREKGNAGDKA